MTKYVVTAPYVTANVGTHDGRKLLGYYAGAHLPDDTAEESIKHLLGAGMIADEAAAEKLLQAEPGEVSTSTGSLTEPGDVPADVVDDVDGDGPIPPKSAPKDAWVAYAVSQGAERGHAEASTKDDLIAAYGGA